jgi:Fe-S oxidoreductase
VYLSGSTGKTEEAFDSGLYLCTSCGACEEICPAKIDTKTGLIDIRAASRSSKKAGISEHESVIASVKNYENPWLVPRARKSKWAKDLDLPKAGEVLYFAGCSTSLISPETAKKAVGVIRRMGVAPAYLGKDERCCGSTVRKLGETKLARQKAEECFRDFKKAGAKLVITSCPGCSSALNHFEDIRDKYGIEVQHISQFLDKRLTRRSLSPKKKSNLVTYHDPCDLGREQGVYDEPRRVIALVTGESPLEMELCKEHSACCGSGAGVRSAYPELANAIATARIEMAKKAGAPVIVTACPWCVESLKECQGDHSLVKVIDLVDLVDENLVKE